MFFEEREKRKPSWLFETHMYRLLDLLVDMCSVGGALFSVSPCETRRCSIS